METGAELPVVRASELASRCEKGPAWLLEGLFSAGGVGVIGGAAKSCKSWLSLEMAVAVEVPMPGPVLLYAAEDAPVDLRDRLAGLAEARQTDFVSLDVGVITEPSLRLDRVRSKYSAYSLCVANESQDHGCLIKTDDGTTVMRADEMSALDRIGRPTFVFNQRTGTVPRWDLAAPGRKCRL